MDGNLIRAHEALLESLMGLAERRDAETGGHILRIRGYVRCLARAASTLPDFALGEEEADLMERAAMLHDIGKMGVPDSVLRNPGNLTEEEFARLRRHPLQGRNVLWAAERREETPLLRLAREIAYGHHERWDGKGFPQGIAGEKIPPGARITAIADVYDALVCRRVYKAPLPHARAVRIILEGRGRRFDPVLTDLFARRTEAFRLIALENADGEEERENLQCPEGIDEGKFGPDLPDFLARRLEYDR
jgi:putative two-component system response regulator